MSPDQERKSEEQLSAAAHTSNDCSSNKDIEKKAESTTESEKAESPTSQDRLSADSNHDPLSQQPSLQYRKSTANAIRHVAAHLTTVSLAEPGPPPDGGLTAWTQCFLTWLVVFNTWGFVNSFGAFQTYYSTTLALPQSTVSWIGSTQAWFLFVLSAFSGRALDAGLLRPVIIIGVVVQLLGLFCLSVSTKYWQLFVTHGVLTGIGGGIFFCPAMGLLSTYFSKHRGLALGISTSGNSTGGIVFPLIIRQLLPRIGFAWTVRVLAFVNLASLALVIALMKPRLRPRKAGAIIEWRAVKDVPYTLFVLGICFLIAAVYFVFYYIGSFARNAIGLPYTGSLNLVILINGVGIPARILPGFIADRCGVLNVVLCALVLNVIMLFAWTAVRDIAGFYTWTVGYGLVAAAFQSLFPAAIASLSTDLSKTGTRLGMAFSVISFAALVAGPIGGGFLQADRGRYLFAQIWAAVSTVVGTLLVLSTRVAKEGWKLRVKC